MNPVDTGGLNSMPKLQRSQEPGRIGLAAGLLLVLCTVMFVLVLLEVGLRLAGTRLSIGYVRPIDLSIYDPYLGWRGAPGASGWISESHNFMRFNSEGYHDREHEKKKPAGTLRIAVLGDSMIEAAQVSLDKTLCSVLERELNNSGTTKTEVINFGNAGYGTAQELLVLRSRVWEYAPDIVVLAFLTGNDLNDNSPAIDFQRSSLKPRPYFVVHDGKLEPYQPKSHPHLAQMFSWLVRHSRVFGVFRAAVGKFAGRPLRAAPELGEGAWPPIYSPPTDPGLQDAWAVTEKLIINMRDEVASHGAKFIALTLSNPVQVDPDPRKREQFMTKIGVSNLFYPDLRLKALCDREGISVTNLAPALQQYAEAHKVFLHGYTATKTLGHGHWNDEGNELAGHLVAQKIGEELQHLRR